jgi:threonine aldolase
VPDDEEFRRVQIIRACDRILSGTRPMNLAERLAQLGVGHDLEQLPDRYGEGPVAELETRVARLLGTEAAAFFPTGTMAQQVTLRCWAERTGNPAVGMHALAHPEVHERHAYAALSGLRAVLLTSARRQPTVEEIRAAEPFGTLLLELPLRDAGFILPTFDELSALVAAGRARGARIHLDGARLWESTPYLGRELAEVAALADSVYVSFYKTLGGLSGAAVAGSAELVAALVPWRHRYGGMLFQQWPAALAALSGLDRELPRLPAYVAQARVVAAALAELPGAIVHPDPPHTHQFQLWLPYPAQHLQDAALAMAEQDKVAFIRFWREDAGPPGMSMAEVTIGEPGLAWTTDEVRAAGLDLLARLAS